MTSFSATVDEFVRETKERMEAMTRIALNDMINDMQSTTDKGGRMRYKTGFLSDSGRASLDGYPSGVGQRPTNALPGQYTWDGSALIAVLTEMRLGDTFYWGWVANYAATREVYDGFMDAPLQNWQGYVDTAVARVKKEVGNAS